MQTFFKIGFIVTALAIAVLVILLCTGIIDPRSKQFGTNRSFIFDLRSQITTHFYPCKISRRASSNIAMPISLWVSGVDRTQHDDEFNNCTVGGLFNSAGWSDVKQPWYDLYVVNYNNDKRLYYGLYRDQRGGGAVIYLRGGYRYEVRTNEEAKLFVKGIPGVPFEPETKREGQVYNGYPIVTDETNGTTKDNVAITAVKILDLVHPNTISGHYTHFINPVKST